MFYQLSPPIKYKLQIFFHILFKAISSVLRIIPNAQWMLKMYLLVIKGSSFIQGCFRYSTSIAFPHKLQNFAYMYKNFAWDLDRNCVKPFYQAGENWHHDYAEFCNPWRWYVFPLKSWISFISIVSPSRQAFPALAWPSPTPQGGDVEVSLYNSLKRLLSCSWLHEWGEAQIFLDCFATESDYCLQVFSF